MVLAAEGIDSAENLGLRQAHCSRGVRDFRRVGPPVGLVLSRPLSGSRHAVGDDRGRQGAPE